MSAAPIEKGSFQGRREAILGGCGKNILFFTPLEGPFFARVCVPIRGFVNIPG